MDADFRQHARIGWFAWEFELVLPEKPAGAGIFFSL
jgi:hypothetical protein